MKLNKLKCLGGNHIYIYINGYYQYIYLHTKENILLIILSLQTNLFKIDLQNKIDRHATGKWLIHGPKHLKDNQSIKKPETYNTIPFHGHFIFLSKMKHTRYKPNTHNKCTNVLCFVLAWLYQDFLVHLCDLFIHILQRCFIGPGKVAGMIVTVPVQLRGRTLTDIKPQQSVNRVYISWWRHQMGPFSALLALCAGNSSVAVNSPHNGQWRGALMFSLICVWINDWVNNREAGDLIRHRGHYDVNVMFMWYTVYRVPWLYSS